ncbi:MAG: carbohydrate ABC transporter permease [Clostridia bacterium]|nr:carbohydrate ABC transporter permease [Clostridia bacterium]
MRLQDSIQAYTADTLRMRKLRQNGKRATKILIGIGRFVFLFCLCLVLLYPILVMLSISLRRSTELYDPTVVWIPKHFTLENYFNAIEKLNLAEIFGNTAIVTIAGTACQLISTMLAGYGFARFKFPGKNILFGILILTIMVPPQVVSIPTMMYFQQFDLFGIGQLVGLFTGEAMTVTLSNTYWAYLLPALLGSGIKSGLFIFIFIQFFRGLPGDLQDAAAIDGCGRFRTFWQIMLPLSSAAILTVTLFSLVWYWNDSYFCVIFFDDMSTVSTTLQNISSMLNDQSNRNELAKIPEMQASAFMSMLPLLIMYITLQKYFTESIERTGIVG